MVPNQRLVHVHREKCYKNFLQIKKENWYAANEDLTPYGLQVYLYLAGNMDGYTLELSQEAAAIEAGIKKTTFHKYINEMIEKGYLIPRRDGSNVYDFYERPQNRQDTEMCSESEQVKSFCGLLCSQDEHRVSPGNKEIDNIQITTHKGIDSKEPEKEEFVF